MAVIRYHPVEIGDYTKGVRIGDSMKPMANAKPFILAIVIVPFLGTVVAIALLWQQAVHCSDLALLAMMYTLTAFGIGIAYHRMLTHRRFRPQPVVESVLVVLG